MKKKKLTQGQTCPEPASDAEKKSPGCFGAFLTALFSLVLTLMLVLAVAILFVHALNENVPIPAIGFISDVWLAEFFDTWYALAFAGILVLLPMLLIMLINANWIRAAFLSYGVSAVAAALCAVASGIAAPWGLPLLPGDWQNTLVNTTMVYRDFTQVCGILLVLFGAACLSVHSCIRVVKGGSHEKDS